MMPYGFYLVFAVLAGSLIILGNEMYQRTGWFLLVVLMLLLLVSIAEDANSIMLRVYRMSVIAGDTP